MQLAFDRFQVRLLCVIRCKINEFTKTDSFLPPSTQRSIIYRYSKCTLTLCLDRGVVRCVCVSIVFPPYHLLESGITLGDCILVPLCLQKQIATHLRNITFLTLSNLNVFVPVQVNAFQSYCQSAVRRVIKKDGFDSLSTPFFKSCLSRIFYSSSSSYPTKLFVLFL